MVSKKLPCSSGKRVLDLQSLQVYTLPTNHGQIVTKEKKG
jgi:hypothetical protein